MGWWPPLQPPREEKIIIIIAIQRLCAWHRFTALTATNMPGGAPIVCNYPNRFSSHMHAGRPVVQITGPALGPLFVTRSTRKQAHEPDEKNT